MILNITPEDPDIFSQSVANILSAVNKRKEMFKRFGDKGRSEWIKSTDVTMGRLYDLYRDLSDFFDDFTPAEVVVNKPPTPIEVAVNTMKGWFS